MSEESKIKNDQEVYYPGRQCGGCRFAKIDDSSLTNHCILPMEKSSGQKGYYTIGKEFFCCHGRASFDLAIKEFEANFVESKADKEAKKEGGIDG